MQNYYYERKASKSYIQWWDEKKETERLREERRAWETKRDEKIQCLMISKERAEDLCVDRIVNRNGKDIYEFRKDDVNLMDIWSVLIQYQDTVLKLQKYIPNLEYDPRIVSDLEIGFV